MKFLGKPDFSIVVPVLNGALTIERALRSLQSQAEVRVEIIVVDGGSKDGTPEIVRKNSQFVTLIDVARDHGQSEALNRGFTRARGRWFGWLCADDELAYKALDVAAALFSCHAAPAIVSGACERVRPDGSSSVAPVRGYLESWVRYANVLDQPSTFWTAKLHRNVGQLDQTLHFAMDWDWWCRLFRAGATYATTNQVLSRYHFTGLNKTSINPLGNLRESLAILKRYGPLEGHIANIYNYIFETYDIKGCLDAPFTASPELFAAWVTFDQQIRTIFPAEIMDRYSLGWISRQMRGLSIV